MKPKRYTCDHTFNGSKICTKCGFMPRAWLEIKGNLGNATVKYGKKIYVDPSNQWQTPLEVEELIRDLKWALSEFYKWRAE